jgi:hypothetical protein
LFFFQLGQSQQQEEFMERHYALPPSTVLDAMHESSMGRFRPKQQRSMAQRPALVNYAHALFTHQVYQGSWGDMRLSCGPEHTCQIALRLTERVNWRWRPWLIELKSGLKPGTMPSLGTQDEYIVAWRLIRASWDKSLCRIGSPMLTTQELGTALLAHRLYDGTLLYSPGDLKGERFANVINDTIYNFAHPEKTKQHPKDYSQYQSIDSVNAWVKKSALYRGLAGESLLQAFTERFICFAAALAIVAHETHQAGGTLRPSPPDP